MSHLSKGRTARKGYTMPRPLSEIHAERLTAWRALQRATNARDVDRCASDVRWLDSEWNDHPERFTPTATAMCNAHVAIVRADLGA